MGKSITPIPASVSCQRDSWTSHDAKVKGKNLTTHLNNPYKPAILLIEGPIAAGISPTSENLGIEVATHSTPRLHQSNGLSKTPEVRDVGQEMPMGSMSIGLVSTPGISSVSLSCMVKDDTMGLVYMDTMTTSVGRVILSTSDSNEGPVIEDITDQSWETLLKIHCWADKPSPVDTLPNFLETCH